MEISESHGESFDAGHRGHAEGLAGAAGRHDSEPHLGVERWGTEEVAGWLHSRQLSRFASNFKTNDVTGKVLLRLTSKALRDDLGVQEPYDRVLMDEIVNLERKSMDVLSWSEADVCNWVKSIGLGEHVDSFLYHNINGELLLQLSRKEIEEDLEMKKFGHRELLIDEIQKLRQMASRKGARILSEGHGRVHVPSHAQADEIARLEAQRQQRLRKELEDLKRKVVQMRDAESRAKMRARQVETEAGKLEKQLSELKEKSMNRPATAPRLTATKPGARRVTQDHCTFKPKLNPHSISLMRTTRGGPEGHDFIARMESEQANRERKLRELIKKQENGDLDPDELAKRLARRKKQCFAYFKRELGWDTSAGIEEHVNKVLDAPENYNLKLDKQQIRHIRKLRGHEQALCLYDQFCVKEFVSRQDTDMSQRKHKKGGDASAQLASREATLKAEEYFKDRFKWAKVDSDRLNDLLDSAHVLELELNEGSLRTLRNLKPQSQAKAVYKALQTKAFLQRTHQDIRKRESNMQLMWRHHAQTMHALGGANASPESVQNFIDRVEEDLRSRGERFQKLVDKVKSQDPNFRECTFQPRIVHAAKTRPQSAK